MAAEAISRRRGGTQGRHHERGSAPLAQLRPVTRRIPDYEYFTEEGLERIHQASMTILEEVGVEFRDPIALAAWRTFQLLAFDDILDRPRRYVTRLDPRWKKEGDAVGSRYRYGLADFITCPYCIGFWVTLAWWGVWLI